MTTVMGISLLAQSLRSAYEQQLKGEELQDPMQSVEKPLHGKITPRFQQHGLQTSQRSRVQVHYADWRWRFNKGVNGYASPLASLHITTSPQ